MTYKRYINACELAEVIENLDIRVAGKPAGWNDAKHSVLREISQAPTADVAEVKHGEWVTQNHSHTCSLCDWYYYGSNKMSYCPHCGAKMDGKKEGTT